MNAPAAQGGAPCYWQKIEYERPNPMPTFPTETQFQQPYAKATDLECRMQNYYAALGVGAADRSMGRFGWRMIGIMPATGITEAGCKRCIS